MLPARKIFLVVVVLALLCGCSDSEQFRINGTIEGKPTQNLRLMWWTDGGLRTAITAARDGEFEFFGSSRQGAVLQITDYDYRPMAMLYVQNGTNYTLAINPQKPYDVRITGGEINGRWADFLRANADSLSAGRANAVVERYIIAHPDDILSTILFATLYDASGDAFAADSLLSLISPGARPSVLTENFATLSQRLIIDDVLKPIESISYIDRRDSLRTATTADAELTLIVLTNIGAFRTDSLVPALRRRAKNKHLQLVDIGLDADTTDWKRGTANDSIKWCQGWLAAGIAAPQVAAMGVPSLPFFVVCDSTGQQLYRGRHLRPALDILDR